MQRESHRFWPTIFVISMGSKSQKEICNKIDKRLYRFIRQRSTSTFNVRILHFKITFTGIPQIVPVLHKIRIRLHSIFFLNSVISYSAINISYR